MGLIILATASIAFLLGYLFGQFIERASFRADRNSLREREDRITKVQVFETPNAARQWQAALEPPKPQKPSEAEAIEQRVRGALTRTDELRGATVRVDPSTRLVSLVSPNPMDPIALHDYTEDEIMRWLNTR